MKRMSGKDHVPYSWQLDRDVEDILVYLDPEFDVERDKDGNLTLVLKELRVVDKARYEELNRKTVSL